MAASAVVVWLKWSVTVTVCHIHTPLQLAAEPALPCPTCTGAVMLQPRGTAGTWAIPCSCQGAAPEASLLRAAAFCPLELILSAVITPICWTQLSQGHPWPQSSHQRCGFRSAPRERAFPRLSCTMPINFDFLPPSPPFLGQEVLL